MKPKKFFGQHFLTDQSVVEKIISTLDKGDEFDCLVEIGPGKGAITNKLIKKFSNKKIFLIEIDRDCYDLYANNKESNNDENQINVVPYLADAINFNWQEFLKENHLENKTIYLASNLPYNAQVPILRQILTCAQIKQMTLMFQKEVADKINPMTVNGEITQKNYGNSLHALFSTYYQIETLINKVAPGSFFPPPKVNSKILIFSRLSQTEIPFEKVDEFEDFLRLFYSFKRKQLRTVFKQLLPEKLKLILKESNLNSLRELLEKRAESLSTEEAIMFYKLLY